ncbi:DEAD/DEAH box helicase [candidate division KSB1 bacterium]|nr:DEAD/DEAH box helicase [candidate division KSB1 bacterium]
MSTAFHAKFFAHELSLHHHAGNVQKLSRSLFDACVDLNPHQIEAALFALRSPLAQGAILADEVGLGKTIEAGLVLCQYWAERRRRLLIICPAALRKQWQQELAEKFNLPALVLDTQTALRLKQQGVRDPIDSDAILIVSIHFAGLNSTRLRTRNWDLVVIDEAHKLRNVFRSSNKLAQSIQWAFADRPKLLLTATPIQNSLLELYGLASLIDEHIFGDLQAFRDRYLGKEGQIDDLRKRLQNFCHRTLRQQVAEYIRYTERRSMTLPYYPTDTEHALYEDISAFLQHENSYAFPPLQRHLTTLIVRKILASSTYAIAGTLDIVRRRLIAMREGQEQQSNWLNRVIEAEEIEDEWLEQIEDSQDRQDREIDPVLLQQEIDLLDGFIVRAQNIRTDTKSETLLKALEIGFDEMKKTGAPRKAILFTESRRTQDYLCRFLAENGYAGELVLFNGSPTDDLSREIYSDWLKRYENSGRITGSRPVDMRTALIDRFRENASILIATEAAGEGINLQFCALVINYDLPWNPQRIEQRIGRCHRYGQNNDVVVINFINERNETDQRVFELLTEKFSLFSGVFGASDEVLGTVESGVDFEKRIHSIYQDCRSPEEISQAFGELRNEMEQAIQNRMDRTRQILIDHFDQDVHKRLKVQLDAARQQLDRISGFFWDLSKFVLADVAQFDDEHLTFDLLKSPLQSVKPGRYRLISKTRENTPGDFLFRLSHPLGEYVIAAGKASTAVAGRVYFDISNHPTRITPLERMRGQSGWLALSILRIRSFEQEDYRLLCGFTDKGKNLDSELCESLFYLRAAASPLSDIPQDAQNRLNQAVQKSIGPVMQQSIDLNSTFFLQECDKLDRWAEEQIALVERELEMIRRDLELAYHQGRLLRDPVEQHKKQVEIAALERRKQQVRKRLFQIEDDVTNQRESLIDKLEKRMTHEHEIERIFTVRWTLI